MSRLVMINGIVFLALLTLDLVDQMTGGIVNAVLPAESARTLATSWKKDVLLQHPQLVAAAEALPCTQEGLNIYVFPEQHGPVREHLRSVGVDFGNGRVFLQQLRCRHIITNDNLRRAVLDALSCLRSSLRVKVKRTAWFFLPRLPPTPRRVTHLSDAPDRGKGDRGEHIAEE